MKENNYFQFIFVNNSNSVRVFNLLLLEIFFALKRDQNLKNSGNSNIFILNADNKLNAWKASAKECPRVMAAQNGNGIEWKENFAFILQTYSLPQTARRAKKLIRKMKCKKLLNGINSRLKYTIGWQQIDSIPNVLVVMPNMYSDLSSVDTEWDVIWKSLILS